MMTEKVKAFMTQQQMLRAGDGVIVGLSGGADSVCLLHILRGLRGPMDLKLLAVHVSHGIRGKSAWEDEVFCEKLCKCLNVPFRLIRVDIPALSERTGMSIEEAGRNFRYETFTRILREERFDKIAIAHHMDDNAETVLANLCRGTGLSGAGGISPVNGVLIRPLLCVRREEIEAFLSEIGQPYRIDETNDDTAYTRNRIRHDIIPRLEEVNPEAVPHVNEAARIFREAEAYAERMTREAAGACLRIMGKGDAGADPVSEAGPVPGDDAGTGMGLHKSQNIQACIDLNAFRNLDPFIRERLLLSAMEEVCGCRKDLGSVHVKSLLDLTVRQSGRQIDLPYGMRAVREYDHLRIYRPGMSSDGLQGPSAPEGGYLIPKEDLTDGFYTTVPLPTGELQIHVFQGTMANFIDLTGSAAYTKYVDCDKITQYLCIRTCAPDDVIGIDAAGHHKTVRRYLMDCRIPAAQRKDVMAASDGDKIVWILGGRIGYEYRLGPDTMHVLKLEWKEPQL